MKRTPWHRVVPLWIGSYFLIVVWEFLATPASSHSDSWRGVWLSLLALPFVSCWLACRGAQAGTLFAYGSGAAILFVRRFLLMDRFVLWMQYQAPSDLVIMFSWIAFTLVLGGVCALAGLLAPTRYMASDPAKGMQDER